MAIKKLINPLSENYKQFKKLVNHQEFTWHWMDSSVQLSQKTDGYLNLGYYTHAFLTRPETGQFLFPKQSSDFLREVQSVMLEILLANNIKPAIFYRISANCEHPHESNLPNMPHNDHQFPHENLLIYLNDPKGGYTMVENEKYYGKEDDVILFNGFHCNAHPKTGRRLVSIATFLRYN